MKKRWILALAALTISLAACEKETNTAPASAITTARVATGGKFKAVPTEQLPTTIRTYIQNQYTDATIKHAGKGPRGNFGILVEQKGAEKALFFKADGKFKAEHDLERKSLDASALPALATKYLQKNYAIATINAWLRAKGQLWGLIQTGDDYQLLAFTKNGAFLKEITGGSGGKLVEPSELPATISSYVESHYTGATIKGAGQGPKGKYGVVIDVDGKRKLVLFDQAGNFLRELSR